MAGMFKLEKQKQRELHHYFLLEANQKNYEQKLKIKQSLMAGDMKKREFLYKKRQDALLGKSLYLDDHRHEISLYEQEAQYLEQEEA